MQAASGAVVFDGAGDLAAASRLLADRLPVELEPLARLAYNYWWSWNPPAAALFKRIDSETWERTGENPVRLLQEMPPVTLRALAQDPGFVAEITAVRKAFERYLAGWPTGDPVAYLCAEFGVHASLPFYAGGLGVLAGDYLKAASDDSAPVVGVGLLYSQGSFHQLLDVSGWQTEYWLSTDPERIPAAVVTRGDGDPVVVTVPIRGRHVLVRAWRVDVGRTPLFLLDTNMPGNEPADRWITARLYVGDRETRLAQYAVLGMGGVRLLRAMGIQPAAFHLNEGHAALALLELLGEHVRSGSTLEEGVASVRAATRFTTHTPVAAGNESFTAEEVQGTIPGIEGVVGLPLPDLLALGRVRPDDASEAPGLTPLAIRLGGRVNAVSRPHQETARKMWAGMWPGLPPDAAPIGCVTNGIHVPTWMAAEVQALLDERVPGWRDWPPGSPAWEAIEAIPDDELWAVRCAVRSRLIETVRSRSVVERLGRGESLSYAESAVPLWEAHALTVGFARRIATYKRLYLLSRRLDWALKLLNGPREIQIVIAGRAHPRDEEAKRAVQAIFASNDLPGVGGHGVFLEDYDMRLAAQVVQGCDLWLNLPRPPLEASGTSGMKSAVNGGLQLSVLDGWWAEAFDGRNGWGITSDSSLPVDEQDRRDADAVFSVLESEVVPLFYDCGPDGIPHAWVRMMKRSLITALSRYSARRMLADYLRAPEPAIR